MVCVAAMSARAFALCVVAFLFALGTGMISTENNSEKLAKSLRRQLIQNNYDYMSSPESQETFRTRANYRKLFQRYNTPVLGKPSSHRHYNDMYKEKYSKKKPTDKSNVYKEDLKDERSIINSKTEFIDDELEDIVQGKEETIKKIPQPHDIFRVKDEKDKRLTYKDKISYDNNYFIDKQQVYNNNDHNIQTTTVKYKIFKVNKSYRRSGNPSTLIQEETADGVSIVNVGGGPFPEFRLPLARRQYMHLPEDIGVIDEDEELPPPPVNDTNIIVEEKPKYNEPLNILQPEDHSKDAQNMSLMITVTPDEIFVL